MLKWGRRDLNSGLQRSGVDHPRFSRKNIEKFGNFFDLLTKLNTCFNG